jgi:hypothetical protein
LKQPTAIAPPEYWGRFCLSFNKTSDTIGDITQDIALAYMTELSNEQKARYFDMILDRTVAIFVDEDTAGGPYWYVWTQGVDSEVFTGATLDEAVEAHDKQMAIYDENRKKSSHSHLPAEFMDGRKAIADGFWGGG